jgi:twitching motility protein PilT
MARIDAFFKLMHEQGASDLHLASGSPPIFRIRGDLQRIKYKILENDELKAMLYEIAPENKIKVFEETGDVDFGYEIPGLARYRSNFLMQKNGIGAVFREIPSKILSAEQLGLPDIMTKLSMLPRGLILVTGPTGSGKSTTLAAIMDHANRNRKDHIITVEDPIEFVHENKGCLVNHREVGSHIMGTLHTISAAKTVDRMIEIFPTHQQPQVRATLADALRAVISQTMFKRIDIQGRCVAFEILIATPAVRNLIREGKTYQVPSSMQTGKKFGMQTLDDAIMELMQNGRIHPDEAYNKCVDKAKFKPFAKSAPLDFTEVG